MRSYDPQDKYDREEAERLAAPAWMLDTLTVNPGYCSWGPHEDYMMGKDAGWRSPVFAATWRDFNLAPDDLNEIANFYFSVERDNEECAACGGGGYNPATRRIADAFYRHSCPPGVEPWNDKITQDEVAALAEHRRLHDFGQKWDPETQTYSLPRMPTADEVNAKQGRGFMVHDAINRGVLIEARARRLGVYGHCPKCEGHGYVYTAPEARLALTLWVLHPRKGASRGWEVSSVARDDLPAAFAFLREAARRNAERFSRIPSPVDATPDTPEDPRHGR